MCVSLLVIMFLGLWKYLSIYTLTKSQLEYQAEHIKHTDISKLSSSLSHDGKTSEDYSPALGAFF